MSRSLWLLIPHTLCIRHFSFSGILCILPALLLLTAMAILGTLLLSTTHMCWPLVLKVQCAPIHLFFNQNPAVTDFMYTLPLSSCGWAIRSIDPSKKVYIVFFTFSIDLACFLTTSYRLQPTLVFFLSIFTQELHLTWPWPIHLLLGYHILVSLVHLRRCC